MSAATWTAWAINFCLTPKSETTRFGYHFWSLATAQQMLRRIRCSRSVATALRLKPRSFLTGRDDSVVTVRSFSSARSSVDAHPIASYTKDGGDVHWRTSAWEETFLPALGAYKQANGDARVPRAFVVPDDDASWPRVAWGYRLGKAVNQLRCKLRDLTQELPETVARELKKLGFIENVWAFQ